MAITNLKTYQEASLQDKINFLKDQSQIYINTITTIENSFKKRLPSAEAKAHTCALLMQIGTGTFNVTEKYQTAEEVAALSLFNSSQSNIKFTNYTAHTNYLAPRIAVCSYLLDSLEDNKVVSRLEQLNLIPRSIDQNSIKQAVQQTRNLLGLAIAFSTLDQPINYSKTAFIAALGVGAVFVGSVVAGAILLNPLFLIPIVIGLLAAAKLASASQKCEQQFTNYKNSLNETFAAGPIKKGDNINLWESASRFEFFAVKTLENAAKDSEQFAHIELPSLQP